MNEKLLPLYALKILSKIVKKKAYKNSPCGLFYAQ